MIYSLQMMTLLKCDNSELVLAHARLGANSACQAVVSKCRAKVLGFVQFLRSAPARKVTEIDEGLVARDQDLVVDLGCEQHRGRYVILCIRLDLLGNSLQFWDSIFRAQLIDVGAVKLDATANPLLVQVDENTGLNMRRVAAGLLAKTLELCREVFLALAMHSPQARLFL